MSRMIRLLPLPLSLLVLSALPAFGDALRASRDVVGAPVSFEYSLWPMVVAPGGRNAVSFPGAVGEVVLEGVPDPEVATIRLEGDYLTIDGVAPGTTSMVVTDSARPELGVTLEIRVSEPDEPPAVPTNSHCHTLAGDRSKLGCSLYVTADGGATLSIAGIFPIGDRLDISGSLWLFDDHIGLTGRRLAVARYNGRLFQRDGEAWVAWDGDIDSLSGLEAWRPLERLEQVEAASGISGLTGDFTVYIGYQVADEVVFTGTPVRFSVSH